MDPAANLMKTTLSQCSKESNYITHKRTYGFVYENLHNWTRSMWSFNPETNILLNVPLHGTILTRPLLESELVIGAVILRGHLRIAGHHLGRCDIKDLPKEITVATSRTLSYYKLGASQRVAGDSGFAAYSRYRIGNYKLNTDHSSSSDNIALLVQ